MRTVIVEFLDGKHPVELVQIPQGMTALQVVEKMQKNYRALGHQDGVKWQVVDGTTVDALVGMAQAEQDANANIERDSNDSAYND